MPVEIPLHTGLVLQSDPEEVGTNGCTVLHNADFTTLGSIKKRPGNGSSYFANITFIQLYRWYNSRTENTYRWIGITSGGGVYYSYNLTDWHQLEGALDIGVVNGKPFDGRLYDYNSQLRFSADLLNDAKLYQYIDRDFFWSGMEGTPGFYSDTARPRADALGNNITTSFDIMTENLDSWFRAQPGVQTALANRVWSGDTLNLSTNSYFYKYALVFDGNQESPLSTLIGDTTSNTTSTKAVPAISFTINTGTSGDLANWNKRITAINIYRSTSLSGTYTQVGTISTLSDDPNIIKVTDVIKGEYIMKNGETCERFIKENLETKYESPINFRILI